MTISDGTETFKGDQVTGDKLDTVSGWHGTTLPTAGPNEVPANGLFLLTATDGSNEPGWYENTNTKASPTFTKRTGFGLGTEQSSTPITDDTQVGGNNNFRHYSEVITFPTTEEFYIITGIEWKNGLTVAGNVLCGVDYVDTIPAVSVNVIAVAITSSIAQSGVSSIQRNSVIRNYQLIPGGAKVSAWINMSSSSGLVRRRTRTSGNVRKTETFTTTPAVIDTGAWTASVIDMYLKIYFKGYS